MRRATERRDEVQVGAPLRGARVARAWGVDELVARLRRAAPSRLPDDLAELYRRWEEGQERPSEFYLRLLVGVFGHPVTWEPGEEPTVSPVPEDDADAWREPPRPSWVRQARKARGWECARLAGELCRVAGERGIAIASPNSLRVMISRWDNGRALPGEVYQGLLAEVLEAPVSPSVLRDARERRGWTQAEVVAALRQVAPGGLPADLLNQYKRWERGRHLPSRFYAELLERVLGPAEGLRPGVKSQPPVPVSVREVAPHPGAELVAALLRVLESGANLVIGIAPSPALAAAMDARPELGASGVSVVVAQPATGLVESLPVAS